MVSKLKKEPIISVSGLRGIVGESLSPINAAQYVAAFVSGLKRPGKVIVTRDGRTTGPMLAQAIASAVQACGFDVLYGDVAATPTTGILVRSNKAAGGIQISASHNPPPYNGIKLFGEDGRVISADQGQAVIDRYRNGTYDFVAFDQVGTRSEIADTITAHLQLVLNTINREAIRNARFKVALDSNHGAGAVLGEVLLRELGCDVQIMGREPDGLFEHPPEPTEKNLASVVSQAKTFGADVVFCQDPDADRLAIIDETGNYIGEEYTLALTMDHALSQLDAKGKIVVTNCSSSRMSADIAARHGAQFQMSAVGEANVTGLMIESKAVYGGEGNGGPIDPRVGYVRDSFAAMAQVLDLMAARKKSISELARELPRYEIHKTTVAVAPEKVAILLDRLADAFHDATPNRKDGLRLDWDNRWLLVRPSNTEPIVRAIAEAESAHAAQELCERTASLASEL
ncbi:MAG: phosphoglucosamine mutase [Pirellulaceae bacterium]